MEVHSFVHTFLFWAPLLHGADLPNLANGGGARGYHTGRHRSGPPRSFSSQVKLRTNPVLGCGLPSQSFPTAWPRRVLLTRRRSPRARWSRGDPLASANTRSSHVTTTWLPVRLHRVQAEHGDNALEHAPSSLPVATSAHMFKRVATVLVPPTAAVWFLLFCSAVVTSAIRVPGI